MLTCSLFFLLLPSSFPESSHWMLLLMMLPTTTRKKEREAAIAPNGLVVQLSAFVSKCPLVSNGRQTPDKSSQRVSECKWQLESNNACVLHASSWVRSETFRFFFLPILFFYFFISSFHLRLSEDEVSQSVSLNLNNLSTQMLMIYWAPLCQLCFRWDIECTLSFLSCERCELTTAATYDCVLSLFLFSVAFAPAAQFQWKASFSLDLSFMRKKSHF